MFWLIGVGAVTFLDFMPKVNECLCAVKCFLQKAPFTVYTVYKVPWDSHNIMTACLIIMCDHTLQTRQQAWTFSAPWATHPARPHPSVRRLRVQHVYLHWYRWSAVVSLYQNSKSRACSEPDVLLSGLGPCQSLSNSPFVSFVPFEDRGFTCCLIYIPW